MKSIAFIFLLSPIMTFAQSRADYEQAMSNFMKFYNHNDFADIAAMFPADSVYQHFVQAAFGGDKLENSHKKYGDMVSYKYLGVTKEDGVTVFKTTYNKGTYAMSFTLGSEGKFGTFRHITYSDEINEMLKESNKEARR